MLERSIFGILSRGSDRAWSAALILSEGEVMLGGSAADGLVFDEFIGNDFDGGPSRFVGEQVLSLIEHLVHKLRRLTGIAGGGQR